MFLVAATLGNPDRIALAKTANAALGSIGALILAALSARIFRSRSVAVATGVAAAVAPSLLYVCADVQSEPLFLIFLLGSAWLLLAAADRPSSTLAFAAGFALALATLTRASALAVVPFLAAPLFDRRWPGRLRAHLAAAAFAGCVLGLAPWTLRNAIVFRRPILVSDMGGSTFYDGNSEWTRRFYEIRNRAGYERWGAALNRSKEARIAALARSDPAAAARPSEYFGQIALAECLARPDAALALWGRKALDWLRLAPRPWFHPPAAVWALGLLYAVLFLLAALGLAAARRRGVARFAIAFLAVTMAAHVAILVVWRYRVPYWDPVLLLYAVPAAFRWVGTGR